MKKNTTRLTAALCATMLSVGVAGATNTTATETLHVANPTKQDTDLISTIAPLEAGMVYGTISAVDSNKLTLDVTTTENPYTLDVVLADTTAVVNCATGLAYDPTLLTVGVGVYAYTAAGAIAPTAIVANMAMDMKAPTLITVASVTEADGVSTITDLLGETYTVDMGTTILNRYVAWNLPATMDMPRADEIVVGRNLLVTTPAFADDEPLYRCTMLPMVETITPEIAPHTELPTEETTTPEAQTAGGMILVNGEPIEATTKTIDGTVFFPLRAVADAFDIDVSWSVADFCASVTVEGDMVTALPFDADTKLIDDLTYVSYDVVVNTLNLQAPINGGAISLSK